MGPAPSYGVRVNLPEALTARRPAWLAAAIVACLAAAVAFRSLAWGPLGAVAEDAEAEAPFDKAIHVIYSVNNLGYTDTCG